MGKREGRKVKKKAGSGLEERKKMRLGERGGERTSMTVHNREKKMVWSRGNARDDMLVLKRM